MALLEIKNVNVRYIMKDKKVHACQHVSLEIEEQDSIGIVGESGSGKSTLASAILRNECAALDGSGDGVPEIDERPESGA